MTKFCPKFVYGYILGYEQQMIDFCGRFITKMVANQLKKRSRGNSFVTPYLTLQGKFS
jgi:hypothetical protein